MAGHTREGQRSAGPSHARADGLCCCTIALLIDRSLQVMSAMMLAMVASAVVSTVSMSAVMVQRAQQAATPSPAAALAALIATPSPTPRCSSQSLSVAGVTFTPQWLTPPAWLYHHCSSQNACCT